MSLTTISPMPKQLEQWLIKYWKRDLGIDGNDTCRTKKTFRHAGDGRDEGTNGTRLLDGRSKTR